MTRQECSLSVVLTIPEHPADPQLKDDMSPISPAPVPPNLSATTTLLSRVSARTVRQANAYPSLLAPAALIMASARHIAEAKQTVSRLRAVDPTCSLSQL